MKLKQVTINNFRNVEHVEHDLSKVNIFTGPNKLGKTNTMMAIYWTLLGYLPDGSSDDASLKPIGATDKEVSVELEFDTFKFKKVFYENWVKTRGTDEVTMQGHITDYYINDTQYKVGEAKKELLKLLGTDSDLNTTKFDLTRAIMDPYYLGKVCKWQDLRTFIIELIGDGSNDDVMATNSKLLPIKDRLALDGFDTAKTSKYFKQQITLNKELISDKEQQIKGLQLVKDVSQEAIEEAKSEINKIDGQIMQVKQSNGSTNIVAEGIEKSISAKRLELSKSIDADREELSDKNRSVNSDIYELEQATKKKEELLKIERDNLRRADNTINDESQQIANAESLVVANDTRLNRLRSEFKTLANLEFNSYELPTVQSCPECGAVLNQSVIDDFNKKQAEAKSKFEKERDERLDAIEAEGKELSAQNLNLNLKISDLRGMVAMHEETRGNYQKVVETLNKELIDMMYKKDSLRESIVPSYVSDKTVQIQTELNTLINDLQVEMSKANSNDIDSQIQSLREHKKQYDQILMDHHTFVTTQNSIKMLNEEISKIQSSLTDNESKLLMVQMFIQTKLNLFKDRIASVFGYDVKFTLIEENIKEGSWNEVCYPSVIGKETPFMNGSGSEQILTGIYLSECIKKKLGLNDLPYIFDECDKLDTASLAGIQTASQIISTKVDDINYKKVTLVTA